MLARFISNLRNKGVSVDEVIETSNNYELKTIVKSFDLYLKDLQVGKLSFSKDDNLWYFEYSEDFKRNADNYNLIIGFPDINKKYRSEVLWPFFNIRIPGLKQPKIKEILYKENISPNDDVKLLERFGKKSISNPFELQITNG